MTISSNNFYRRRLIATAKATQYRHGKWVPNMHVQEEFTKRDVTVNYKKRTLGQLSKLFSINRNIVDNPLQEDALKVGIPHKYVD